MKRIYSVLCIAASIIAAASCTKEAVNEASVRSEQAVLGAVTEQVDGTRTALKYGESITIVWSAGDKLTVLDDKGAKGTFTLATGAGNESGTFKGSLPMSEDATCFYAVYPQNDNITYANSAVNVALPSVQNYTENNVAVGANMSIAKFTLETSGNLSFKNVCGVLKLQLKGTDKTVKSITVRDIKGAALAGKASITLDEGNIPSLAFTEGESQVALDCGAGVSIANPTTFHIVLPAGVFSKGLVVKVIDTDNNVYTLRSDVAGQNTIERSVILAMPLRELTTPDEEIDLSDGESSNCYVINEVGSYKFKANVMGNGKTVGDIAPTAIAPVSAKVLWSTYNTGTAPENEDCIITNVAYNDADKCIHFDANGVKGNVVIAAYDNADPEAEGAKIVWSWHIWSDPDLDIYGQSPANVIAGFNNGAALIDRELGALSNEKDNLLCAGLRYVWGRKDPFTGPKNYKSNGTTFADEQSVQGTVRSIKNNKTDIATTIANPTNLYYTNSGWQLTVNNALWGGTYDSSSHTGTTTKTIYDPCPKGYQVVPNGTFYNCKKSGTFSYGSYLVTTDASATNMGWFPAAGVRGRDTGLLKYVSQEILCWSSYSAGGAVSYLHCSSSSFSPTKSTADNQGFAISVRCCKIPDTLGGFSEQPQQN